VNVFGGLVVIVVIGLVVTVGGLVVIGLVVTVGVA
jgi:hypothetical protein